MPTFDASERRNYDRSYYADSRRASGGMSRRLYRHYYEYDGKGFDADYRSAERQEREERRRSRERNAPRNEIVRDTEGHLRTSYISEITPRFRLRRVLGKGTFGKVVEAVDEKYGDIVAIKVVRNVRRYREDAQYEIRVLEQVRHHNLCSRMLKWFDFYGHICIVFEKLGKSLLDVIDEVDHGFHLDTVRSISKQIFETLRFFHEELKLIHTDLKLENILFANDVHVDKQYNVSPDSVRIIDFGGATFDDEKKSSIINTRHYRAPEVILGMGWSFPSDMWSIGCMMYELYTAELLFDTHDDREHLRMMEVCLGPFEPDFVAKIDNPKMKSIFTTAEVNGERDNGVAEGKERENEADRKRGRASRDSGPVTRKRRLDESEQRDGGRKRRRENERSSGSSRSTSTTPAATAAAHPRVHWPAKGKEISKSQERRLRKVQPLEEEFAAAQFRNFVDLMRRCLTYDPAQRITAREALNHPFFQEN